MKKSTNLTKNHFVAGIKKKLLLHTNHVLFEIPTDVNLSQCGNFKILLDELARTRLLVRIQVYKKTKNNKSEQYEAFLTFIDERLQESKRPPAFLTHEFGLANGWTTNQVFEFANLNWQDSVTALGLAKAYIDRHNETDVWIFPTGYVSLACAGMTPARQNKLFSAFLQGIEKARDLSEKVDESITFMDLTPALSYLQKVHAGNVDTTLDLAWKSFFGPLLRYCLDQGKKVEVCALMKIDYCNRELHYLSKFAETVNVTVTQSSVELVTFNVKPQKPQEV